MSVEAIPSGTGSSVARSMDQQQLSTAKEFVRDLVDGQEVDSTFIVRERAYKESRRGERYPSPWVLLDQCNERAKVRPRRKSYACGWSFTRSEIASVISS